MCMHESNDLMLDFEAMSIWQTWVIMQKFERGY